jgi:hypothetical protein
VKFAILIAVENPVDLRLPRVKFAEGDATALADVLVQHGFEAIDRVMLLGDQATRTNIESRVKRVIKGLDASDELIFFYSGHGFSQDGSNFLACHDTIASDLPGSSMSLTWLLEQLRNSECQKMACFLDVSHGDLQSDGNTNVWEPLLDSELKDFFGESEQHVCLVSCRSDESSYVSGALKHGIWTYHVIQAFDGRAPAALVQGMYLTASSLQKYLKREIPRTLTKTFTTKKHQTPWMAGAVRVEFPLADLTRVLAERKQADHAETEQIKSLTLLARDTQGVRELSGFKKTHQLPDRLSHSSQAFIAKIASEEIEQDIQHVFSRLKAAFRFRRADLDISNLGEGGATIITPHFNYSIRIELDPANTSQVIFHRTVDAIREPDAILSEPFAGVFERVFDTLELDMPQSIPLTELIDRIEELDDDRIQIQYDPAITYCTLQIQGVAGAITVTLRTLSIVHSKAVSPKKLLQSFFDMQRILVNQNNVRLIPTR